MVKYSAFLTLMQVCQPRCCPSIYSVIKIILKKHASYQPLHRSNVAPLGRQPENGCPALPAVGLQRFQQDPEWPSCSCLHGTEVTCEKKHLGTIELWKSNIFTLFDIDSPSLLLLEIQSKVRSFLHRNWSPLPNTCWSVSLHWRHRTTRRTLNYCSGKMWGLSVRWPKATAKMGWCSSVVYIFTAIL